MGRSAPTARRALSQLAFYLSFALAAPLGDYVFEPALSRHGWLVPAVGWLMGNGPGVGYSFEIVLASVAKAIVGLIGFLVPSLVQVEAREPDHVPIEAGQSPRDVAALTPAPALAGEDVGDELAARL